MSEVQGLLGVNLPDLKTYENTTVVHTWITRQLQSDLDKLNLGLLGGRVAATATTASANATVVANANATIATPKPTGTHTCTGTHIYTGTCI